MFSRKRTLSINIHTYGPEDSSRVKVDVEIELLWVYGENNNYVVDKCNVN